MTSIYYLFIALPIFIFGFLSFIFQSSVTEIEGQQFLINCPYPIYEGVAENVNIEGVFVTYTIAHNRDINGNTTTNVQDKVGTRFDCTETAGLLGVSTAIHEYGSAEGFTGFPYGWFGYISHVITEFLSKIQPTLTMIYLIINAPAIVTGLAFFNYLDAILISFIVLGLFMIARG